MRKLVGFKWQKGNNMEIPKDLKAKHTKKYEEAVYDLISEYHMDGFSSDEIINGILKLQQFYTQPLQPEMIDKYFKIRLEKLSETSWGDEFIDLTVLNDETMGILVDIDSIELSNHTVYHFEPHTLSDFIDCCINSNIEIKWKE